MASAIWVEGIGKKENMAVDVDWSEEEVESEAWEVVAGVPGSFGVGVSFGSGESSVELVADRCWNFPSSCCAC